MSKYVGFRLGKVHESHVISEYYCGGCGWPVTDHDSFCPECGGAFRECDASNLESENAKLREYVTKLEQANIVLDSDNTDLLCDMKDMQFFIAENAKLRELVRWMYDRMDESCAVQHPYAPAPISYDRLMQAATRAHELGVEVDE